MIATWTAALVLAAVTLSGTLPDHRAAGGQCGPGQTTLTDLDSLYLWGRTLTSEQVVAAFWVQGMEGTGFQCSIPDTYLEAGWQTTRQNHARSCITWVRVPASADVPNPAPPDVAPLVPVRFDVMGRRMEPGPSGIYFTPGKRKVRRVK